MLPLFLDLTGRRVVLVGEGPVADAKHRLLTEAGAEVRLVAPSAFEATLLDDAWLVVTAADAEVNGRVAHAAAARRMFVNAADDPPHASAYLSGVVQRDGVTIAISTEGVAPGLTGLLREALDALLPADIGNWVERARTERAAWRRAGVRFEERRPLLLRALNQLYEKTQDREPALEPRGQ